MPEVSAGIRRQIVVSEAGADVDSDRSVRHTVIEGGRVRIAVEVDRVLLEQVGTHDHADVGQGEKELIVFVDRHQRRWDVAVHHADIHDRPGINVAVERRRNARGCGRGFECVSQSRGARGEREVVRRRESVVGDIDREGSNIRSRNRPIPVITRPSPRNDYSVTGLEGQGSIRLDINRVTAAVADSAMS